MQLHTCLLRCGPACMQCHVSDRSRTCQGSSRTGSLAAYATSLRQSTKDDAQWTECDRTGVVRSLMLVDGDGILGM